MSVQEVCDVAGISCATLYRRIAAGELRAVKCGRRTFFRAVDFQDWVESFPAIEPRAA
ncbi:helix-turn-helix domain-containing protein [Nisaea sediminum]|uniref:helix-turn-helix domain-containing protein n=1 Tax=Nisaea sediminum TaxID=2775867 RepID=UPI001D00F992